MKKIAIIFLLGILVSVIAENTDSKILLIICCIIFAYLVYVIMKNANNI